MKKGQINLSNSVLGIIVVIIVGFLIGQKFGDPLIGTFTALIVSFLLFKFLKLI